MIENYPFVLPNHELHLTAGECTLFKVIKEKGLPKGMLGMKEFQQWKIPQIAAIYLSSVDGKTTHKDICNNLNVPFRFTIDQIADYLENEINVIGFSESPVTTESELYVTGIGYFNTHV